VANNSWVYFLKNIFQWITLIHKLITRYKLKYLLIHNVLHNKRVMKTKNKNTGTRRNCIEKGDRDNSSESMFEFALTYAQIKFIREK
jgi:hypothetical protein